MTSGVAGDDQREGGGGGTGVRPTRRRQLMVGAGILALGTVAGVAVKSVDGSVPDWLRDVGNSPAVFVFALAVIARMAATVVLAAVHSAIFFTALCTAYYAWSTHALGFGGGRFVYLWGGLAVTLVPALAAAVRWAVGRSGALPAAVVAALAGVALVGGVRCVNCGATPPAICPRASPYIRPKP